MKIHKGFLQNKIYQYQDANINVNHQKALHEMVIFFVGKNIVLKDVVEKPQDSRNLVLLWFALLSCLTIDLPVQHIYIKFHKVYVSSLPNHHLNLHAMFSGNGVF